MASSLLFSPCPPALSALVEPYAAKLGLHTLPLHIHQVIGAFLAYHGIFAIVSPVLSKLLLPQTYNSFNRRTRTNWNVHVVSFVQSTFICALAIWVAYNDPERDAWSRDEAAMLKRTFGHSPMLGAVQAYAEGYFIWDLFMSAWHFDIFGIGFLMHALSAVLVFSLGFVSVFEGSRRPCRRC
jgi:glycerol uptake facilitator-like aquaporin